MQCPHCNKGNPDASLYCGYCGKRLFAYLGDPFGNLEAPPRFAGVRDKGRDAQLAAGAAVAAPAPAVALEQGTHPWAWKAGVVGLVVLLLFPLAPAGAIVLATVMGFLLRNSPQVKSAPFALMFTVSLLLVPLVQSMARSASPSSPAPVATASPRPRPTSDDFIDHVNRGNALYWDHKYEEAVREFERAKQLSTTTQVVGIEIAFNQSALAMVPLRRYDEALADVNVALTRVPDSIHYLETRAYVLLSSGSCEAALEDYTSIVKRRQSPHPHSYLGRGLSYLCLGMVAEGKSDLLAGLDLAATRKSTDPHLEDLLEQANAALEKVR